MIGKPGIVDEEIDPAEVRHGLREEPDNLRLGGNVGLADESGSARALDLARDRVELSRERAASTVLMPAAAKLRLIAAPMPELAPVITATRSDRSFIAQGLLQGAVILNRGML